MPSTPSVEPSDASAEPNEPSAAQRCAAFDALGLALDPSPLDAAQVLAGTPETASRQLTAGPGGGSTGAAWEVGVWEHTVGTSTDVEADEVFVVLSGRATVEVEGGPRLELSPGTVGLLAAGARTTWRVHQTLRKVYLAPA